MAGLILINSFPQVTEVDVVDLPGTTAMETRFVVAFRAPVLVELKALGRPSRFQYTVKVYDVPGVSRHGVPIPIEGVFDGKHRRVEQAPSPVSARQPHGIQTAILARRNN